MGEEKKLTGANQEYEKVIEGKAGLTVIRMGLIVGNQIEAVGTEHHIPSTKMQHGTPVLYKEQAKER